MRFTKAKNCVLVEVPDLDLLTEGKDISDAIELNYVSREDAKEIIPEPSDISALDVSKATFAEEGATVISFVDIDSGEYRRKIDTKTVRRNVALPSWLNYEAEHAGITNESIEFRA